eukprot:CAMPEP_0173242770 /NCGR_PEP_ID=MMETSP1142-20121109/15135_1 /TAXON_ID=483371 /ORGANISM="non described non described, Strain CCMP2298" /LENGTH=142 /DNA_ID=CAMNT_0014174297 /DNA_START=202 /DNA_END=627 /DNA_ORIENTATION=-
MSSNVQEHHCVASTAPAPALRAAAAPLGAGRPAALGTLRWAGGAITHHLHATVTRSPILPGIFLSLNMRPGCWQLPVLPMTRCERVSVHAPLLPALHHALEALTLAGAADVHQRHARHKEAEGAGGCGRRREEAGVGGRRMW